MCETSVYLIQRMSFAYTQESKAATEHAVKWVCNCVYLSPPLIFLSMSVKSFTPKAKVLDLLSMGYNTISVVQSFCIQRFFHFLDLIVYIFLFSLFLGPIPPKWPSVVLNAKCKCSMMLRNQTAVFHWTNLFPPNWHEAAASSCQSNKLMLSGNDCLLLIVWNSMMLAGEINHPNKQTSKQRDKYSFKNFFSLPFIIYIMHVWHLHFTCMWINWCFHLFHIHPFLHSG